MGLTMSGGTKSRFCARCWLEAELDARGQPKTRACTHCGWIVFVSAELLPWESGLTEDDRIFLKVQKISPE